LFSSSYSPDAATLGSDIKILVCTAPLTVPLII
jgi:hypothetical protein